MTLVADVGNCGSYRSGCVSILNTPSHLLAMDCRQFTHRGKMYYVVMVGHEHIGDAPILRKFTAEEFMKAIDEEDIIEGDHDCGVYVCDAWMKHIDFGPYPISLAVKAFINRLEMEAK